MAKAEVFWIDYEHLIDYGLFWLHIYIHEWFNLAYLISIQMFSLYSWFFYCSFFYKSTKSMKPNGNTSLEWAKFLSLVWEKELFYREVICFLINFLLGNLFQKSPMLKRYFWYLNSWKKYFLVWQFIENWKSFHNIGFILMF